MLEISLKPYLMKILLCSSLQDYYLFLPLEFGKSLFDNVWWNHTLSTILQYLLQSLWSGITILLVYKRFRILRGQKKIFSLSRKQVNCKWKSLKIKSLIELWPSEWNLTFSKKVWLYYLTMQMRKGILYQNINYLQSTRVY